MDGGDRGGVEFGDGPLQSLELFGGPAAVQVGEELVVGRTGLGGEVVERGDEPIPDLGPQLVGCRPGERDDQQFGGGGPFLGDEPGGQRGQRERLSGSCTRLDGELPGRDGLGDVERDV